MHFVSEASKAEENLSKARGVVTTRADRYQAWLDDLSEKVKIIFGFYQVVTEMPFTMPSVPWPVTLTAIWNAFGVVVNLEVIEVETASPFDALTLGSHSFVSRRRCTSNVSSAPLTFTTASS